MTADGGPSPTRILLVEPDDHEASVLEGSLAIRGEWRVTRVRSVLEAIRTAGETTFDAAILDYELPDGTGMDLLDFLRIGSPGIRILMLSDHKSEDVALHALSHGVGDYLVKDKHLERELPLRVAEALDHVDARAALVETLHTNEYEKVHADVGAPDDAGVDASPLMQDALARLVGGTTLAAGVWDARGRPLGVRLLPDLDEEGLGFALATLHGQVGALWTYGNLKPVGYSMLIDVEGGVLGVTAIPGTFLVALLFEAPVTRARAVERLEQAARRIEHAMHG